MELAWKILKDYLEFEGQILHPSTPRTVLKIAFSAGILDDGQVWIDMLDHRNLLSHTSDATAFDTAVQAIHDRYLEAIGAVHLWLMERRNP